MTDDPGRNEQTAAEVPLEQRAQASERRGIALVAAMLAIIVIGGIVVGGHAAATGETVVAESEQYAGLALYAAEKGLADAMSTVNRTTLDAIAVDSTATVMSITSGKTQYQVNVRRVSSKLHLFVSEGTIPRGNRVGATRTVAALTRTRELDGDFDQAMMVFAGAELKGSVKVSGADSVPSLWTGCDSTTNKPGIVAKDTTKVDLIGNNASVTGNPAIEQDTSLTLNDFTVFGSITFDELASVAKTGGKYYTAGSSVTGITPSLSGTACATSTRDNWGAPTLPAHPCHFYFPMIYAAGNFDYGGNSVGQGILLVEGDLNLSGTAVFYGIVVVKGRLVVGSGNSRIVGTVLTANEGEMSNPNELSGNPTVQYSSCGVARAKKYNDYLGLATMVKGRSWFDFTNASGSY